MGYSRKKTGGWGHGISMSIEERAHKNSRGPLKQEVELVVALKKK